ncbi:GNAT family N-acetyltransferase [Streptococcus sp. H31]|uniref:GNAT family N-acetyltransferase n=1 Tax=Streptococcus huangxiaojuni TaxID=3237239 RepID=UPI0034A21A60
MSVKIREICENDKEIFLELTSDLSRFNRQRHGEKSKHDDYSHVLENIKRRALETFENKDDGFTYIILAEYHQAVVGYGLARIYDEEATADNGTGKTGLIDELFVAESVRGQGIGQMLLNACINWLKASGIRRVKLHAYSWNDGAKYIYERNGFTAYALSYEKWLED